VPTSQSRGIGRALIERVFPVGRGDVRSIIATTDVRALGRYYAAGTAARFPLLTLAGPPADAGPGDDLQARRLGVDPEEDRRAQREIERSILDFARGEAEVRWLLEDREGYLYVRDDASVGFAFVGKHGAGPIAALDPVDLSDILLQSKVEPLSWVSSDSSSRCQPRTRLRPAICWVAASAWTRG
jgi:hypothetical protein